MPSYIEYEIVNNLLYVNKAYTPEEFRGRGIATRIMKEVIEYARENNLKIVPICSFAQYFFQKYPEYRDILANP